MIPSYEVLLKWSANLNKAIRQHVYFGGLRLKKYLLRMLAHMPPEQFLLGQHTG